MCILCLFRPLVLLLAYHHVVESDLVFIQKLLKLLINWDLCKRILLVLSGFAICIITYVGHRHYNLTLGQLITVVRETNMLIAFIQSLFLNETDCTSHAYLLMTIFQRFLIRLRIWWYGFVDWSRWWRSHLLYDLVISFPERHILIAALVPETLYD